MAGSPEIQAAPLWIPNEASTPTKSVEEPPSLTPLRRERLARVGDSANRTGLHEPAEPGLGQTSTSYTAWQGPAAGRQPEVTHASRRNSASSVVGPALAPSANLIVLLSLMARSTVAWVGQGWS